MAQSSELSETDAIKRVIAEGRAMDYIDVVDAVEKEYRIKTSSAKVEQVHRDLADAPRQAAAAGSEWRINPTMAGSMTSKLHSPRQTQTPESDAETDHMTLAMQFVRAVGGMNQAKEALEELEAILRK